MVDETIHLYIATNTEDTCLMKYMFLITGMTNNVQQGTVHYNIVTMTGCSTRIQAHHPEDY